MIYAYLYCVSSEYTDKYGLKKLGCTLYPIHRMSTFNTGDAPGIGLEKKYDAIWRVSAKSKKELLRLESHLHDHFRAFRKIREKTGNKTEWFSVSIDSVSSYLKDQPYVLSQLSNEEIHDIHEKSERPRKTKEDEDEYNEEIEFQETTSCENSLKDHFFDTFLPLGTPRRIQLELWDIWQNICNEHNSYKGIVQWPTGTGKTIGMMMLFIHSFDRCIREGTIFRGLLICPKNDILDTLMIHITKLSLWGIEVYEGHNAQLSTLQIPQYKHILVTATHASLTDPDIWNKFPSISHMHYDEVHRITGEEFFERVKTTNIPFLTGTSATPETSVDSQNIKISELFGKPLNIIHRCSIEDAVAEGWIANPRFCVHVLPNTISRNNIIRSFVSIIDKSILDKQEKGVWKGGKVIAYLPRIQEVQMAIIITRELFPDWHLYSAVRNNDQDIDTKSDELFVTDPADGVIRCLFACERYREGSDIFGLEMTVVLMGSTIGSHVLLQVAGRALRSDYDGKEGWCVIVRPSDEGVTEDDVFDSIVLQIMDFIGAKSLSCTDKIRRAVQTFFGTVEMGGRIYDLDETVKRIQQMYIRKEFERGSHKEKYDVVRVLNRELGIQTRDSYFARSEEHVKFIDDPKSYFKDNWISWYHYLGIDIETFPKSKAEWIIVCKERGILTWSQYKEKKYADLPINPSEMYEDFINWDKEFGLEHEFVW